MVEHLFKIFSDHGLPDRFQSGKENSKTKEMIDVKMVKFYIHISSRQKNYIFYIKCNLLLPAKLHFNE